MKLPKWLYPSKHNWIYSDKELRGVGTHGVEFFVAGPDWLAQFGSNIPFDQEELAERHLDTGKRLFDTLENLWHTNDRQFINEGKLVGDQKFSTIKVGKQYMFFKGKGYEIEPKDRTLEYSGDEGHQEIDLRIEGDVAEIVVISGQALKRALWLKEMTSQPLTVSCLREKTDKDPYLLGNGYSAAVVYFKLQCHVTPVRFLAISSLTVTRKSAQVIARTAEMGLEVKPENLAPLPQAEALIERYSYDLGLVSDPKAREALESINKAIAKAFLQPGIKTKVDTGDHYLVSNQFGELFRIKPDSYNDQGKPVGWVMVEFFSSLELRFFGLLNDAVAHIRRGW